MIYTHYNKQLKEMQVFGSLVAIAEHTDIKLSKLHTCFTRQKKTVYEDETVLIKKTKISRSKHK